MKIARVVFVVLLVLLGYLFFWPIRYEPAAWTVPPAVDAPLNDALKSMVVLHPELHGPEAIVFDSDGGLITGTRDGRIVRIAGDQVETLRKGTGRALGLKMGPDGRMWICDSFDGLMAMSLEDGGVERFETGAHFADDLDFGDDGSVYFSDASARNDVDHSIDDLIEHQTTGRLLRYSGGKTTTVADGFAFSNGVAFGPSRDWLVLAETAAYRLWKVHVPSGEKEVFAVLPGFPDNVTWSPSRQVFWVAVGSPRNAAVDSIASAPFLRKVIYRLPKAIQPKPKRHTMVLGYDANGKLVQNLQYEAPDAYSPVASVLEHDGALWLGSFLIDGYARYPLP
jgi:sugar lactone lactonase YvrE